MNHLPGKFVWFEHSSPDEPKARKFYEDLFGWHSESMPMGPHSYSMILNRGAGIGGYTQAAAGARSRWVSYLSVPDVDASYQSALQAGAKSALAPIDFGSVGRAASIIDPGGAPVSLWRGADGDHPDTEKTPSGAWYWNELWTPDTTKAVAFYERVFGFSHDSMDMGPQGMYYVLRKDGIPRAGVTLSVEPRAAPMWLPYVAVDDCDASAAQAKALGGQVAFGPEDIPNIGRFAIVIDPVGAAVAIIRVTVSAP